MKLKLILFVSLSLLVLSLLACNLAVQKTGMAGDGGDEEPECSKKKSPIPSIYCGCTQDVSEEQSLRQYLEDECNKEAEKKCDVWWKPGDKVESAVGCYDKQAGVIKNCKVCGDGCTGSCILAAPYCNWVCTNGNSGTTDLEPPSMSCAKDADDSWIDPPGGPRGFSQDSNDEGC